MTRTITVKGVGSVSARPDFIILTLSITAVDGNYEQAMRDAAEKIAMLERAAEQAGFEKGDLKTLRFHVNTQYDSFHDEHGKYQRQFVGYACAYQMKLAFDFDSERLAAVLFAVANSGANAEWNISFTVKEPDAVSEELLASAAANAKAKAEALCRASHVELGQLLRVDYNWSELNVVSQTRCDVDATVLMAPAPAAMAPEIAPDDIHLSDTACFVWEIA